MPWLISLILIALSAQAQSADEESPPSPSMDAVERSLELWRHEPLLRVKGDPSTRLAPFTTDGCSGGLSAGWEYLAFHLPDLAAKHGDVPPWESCCLEHDRAYHTGGGAKQPRRRVSRRANALTLPLNPAS